MGSWSTRVSINVAARRRNISRLCHFTSIEHLPGILSDRYIWSVARAKQHGSPIARNDMRRFDGCLDHVSVSVQYPNLLLLDSYRRRGEAGWVIVFLDPRLLSRSNTLFCPVNAATKKGSLVSADLSGFRSMFKPMIGQCGVHRPCERSLSHLHSCPTCLQAEVLIEGSIPTNHFESIATIDQLDSHRVQQIIGESNHPPIRVKVVPQLFNREQVIRCISQGKEV